MLKRTKVFVIFIAVSLGVGILSAFLSGNNMNIYAEINTPPLSPPSWLFPIVWSILYIFMGISAAWVAIRGFDQSFKVSEIYPTTTEKSKVEPAADRDGKHLAFGYIFHRKVNENAKCGLVVYAVQLVVNFLWSIIFFNKRAFLFAFLWLIFLWVLILTMIKLFAKVSPKAAYLQIPYFLWVTFAGYLNFMIYLLN